MSKIKELIEKRLKIHGQMEDVAKQVGTDEWTDDKQKQFDGWDTEFEDLTKQIKALEKVEQRKADAATEEGRQIDESKPNFKATEGQKRKIVEKAKKIGVEKLSNEERSIYDGVEQYNRAFDAYLRYGFTNCTEQERGILSQNYVDMSGREFQDPSQVRALGLTGSAGGYLVAQEFMAELEKFMLYYGGILEACRVVRTKNGATMPWPTNNDTANTGRLLAEAGDASSGATDLAFGNVSLLAYNYTSDLIKVARVLLQDDSVPVENVLGESLAERLGRILNTHCTTGDNSSKPQGITVGATQGKVTANATAFTRAEIIDLVHSVNRAYRKSPKAGFMFNDAILGAIKKLAIGTGDDRPIWQPSMREGEPDKLEGFQYWVNDDMASSVATGNKTMLFGDMNKYIVRMVSDVEILRLNERYAEAHQVAFVGFQRFDGRIINSAAIKYLEQT